MHLNPFRIKMHGKFYLEITLEIFHKDALKIILQ